MRNQLQIRSLTALAVSLLWGQATFSQAGYCTIKGTISNKNFVDMVYLIKDKRPFSRDAAERIIDSTIIQKGVFQFKVPAPYSSFYSIRLKQYEKGFTFITTPNSEIKIQCDTSDFFYPTITGSAENTLRKKYHAGLKPLIIKMNGYAISANRAHGDTTLEKKYTALNILWASKIRQYNLRFIKQYPNTLQSLDLYSTYYFLYPPSTVKRYLSNLPLPLRNNPMTAEIAYKKFQEPGELKKIKKFYDLPFFDTARKPIDFAKYYGKIVLIDFWASWCGPCMANMPIIDSIYKSHTGQPFAILSISIDDTMERWKKGIAEYPVLWEQASDLKGPGGLAARYYKVESIPRYLLLNTDGSIISDDVDIDALGNLIKQHLADKK